jgi:hypothetical protein
MFTITSKGKGQRRSVGDRKGAVPSPRRTSLKETPGCLDPIGSRGRVADLLELLGASGNFQIGALCVACSVGREGGRPEGKNSWTCTHVRSLLTRRGPN